jgi:hypothetical protein
VLLVVVFLFSSEVVEKEISPKPRAAWVAIELDNSGLARTGPVTAEGGTPFRLHAVLEAETFSGDTVYYTEARSLEIAGERIPPENLRVWDRSSEPRILWFTVEGFKPFLEIDEAADLEGFRFQENFRADWPRTWSIPGNLRPQGEPTYDFGPDLDLPSFGTQRFHVRIEIFGPKSEITPELRLQSLRAADLPARVADFSTMAATLPGSLAAPSRTRGLTQIEPQSDILAAVADSLVDLYRDGLAFSRPLVLRDLLDQSQTTYEELIWRAVELGVDQGWGETGVGRGDLIRVGNRWVVAVEDRAVAGVLDREDLCFDFDKGFRLRRIGEVFTGDGLIEWARLRPVPSGG